MKHLYLMRHAKSDWNQPGLNDFDRPLNPRGLRAATEMGRRFGDREIRFSATVSSPAVRAAATVRIVAEKLGFPATDILFEKNIYAANRSDLYHIVQGFSPEWNSVLLVGHNPGLTNFTNHLSDAGIYNLATAAVVALELNISSWTDLQEGCGQLFFYDFPKKQI